MVNDQLAYREVARLRASLHQSDPFSCDALTVGVEGAARGRYNELTSARLSGTQVPWRTTGEDAERRQPRGILDSVIAVIDGDLADADSLRNAHREPITDRFLRSAERVRITVDRV